MAIKNLNKKLESMDGVIPDDNSDDLQRILNGRLTRLEYNAASQARQVHEDSKGDLTFTEQNMDKLGEDCGMS